MSMKKFVDKGLCVLSEIPLAVLQTIDSQSTSICCSTCMAFIGDWTTQADMFIDKYKYNENMPISGKCRRKDLCVQQLSASGAGVCCEETNCTSKRSCNAIYCSIACRSTANVSWHALECSSHDDGVIDRENNIMKEFEEHSLKTEEIFLAVRRVITTLCMQNITSVIPLTLNDNIKESINKLQDMIDSKIEITTQLKSNILSTVDWFRESFPVQPKFYKNTAQSKLSSSNTSMATEEGLRETAMESWLLLHSALIEKGLSTTIFGPLLSCSFFGEVLCTLEKYLHSMNMSEGPLLHHLATYLAQRPTVNTSIGSSKSTKEDIYLRNLLRSESICGEKQIAERLQDKLLLITEINALEANAGSIATAAGISTTTGTDEDSLFIFTGKDCHSTCMVLLPFCSRYVGHSCLPNMQVSAHTTTENQHSNEVRIVPTLQGNNSTDTTSLLQCLPRVDIIALHPIVIPVVMTESEYAALGTSLCLSYIDEAALSASDNSFTFESRQEQLNARFQLCGSQKEDSTDQKCGQVCTCIRCNYEVSRPPTCAKSQYSNLLEEVTQHDTSFVRGNSTEDIQLLGHFYMQQNNYHCARVIYASLLSRFLSNSTWKRLLENLDCIDSSVLMELEVSDNMQCASTEDRQLMGEVLHALGATYLEDGDWRRSRQAWKLGLQLCPEHAQLVEEVMKIDCYPEVAVSINHASQSIAEVLVSKKILKTMVVSRSSCNLQYSQFAIQKLHKDYELSYAAVLNADTNKQLVCDHLPSYLKIQAESPPEQQQILAEDASQVFVSCSESEPLVTIDECKWVIDTTEAYAAQAGGWTTSRHYAVPTTDIPVHVVKSTTSVRDSISSTGKQQATQQLQLLDWFRDLFLQRLGPLLATQFQDLYQLDHPVQVAIHDAFVVKYDTGLPVDLMQQQQQQSASMEQNTKIDMNPGQGQTYLPLHCDQSSHSFTIALNSAAEYEGGGTYFPALGSVIRPDVGQVLSFPGGTILHGGEPIIRGKRYILAVFAYLAGIPRIEAGIQNLKSMHDPIDHSDDQEIQKSKRSRHGDCLGLSQVIWKTSTIENTFLINKTIDTTTNNNSTTGSIGEEKEEKSSLFSFNF